jgi:hypothetical protein
MLKRSACRVLSAIVSLPFLLTGQEFYLRAHDRVVFLGNWDPVAAGLVETFVLTRIPGAGISFTYVVGVSDAELPSPDGRRASVIVTAAEGAAVLGKFLERAQSPGTAPRVTVLAAAAPAPGTAVAAELLTVDLRGFLEAAVDRARAIDPELAGSMAPGGVPRGPAGALLAAQAILEAWRSPAVVSAVEIDALRGAVTRAENTTVRELENGRVVAWTQDDQALPAPVDIMDPSILLAMQSSGFARRLDSQTLRIRGMAAERYALTIDGETIGTFHRDQLDAGLNLALLRTPMWKRARAVLALTRRHDELRTARRKLMETPRDQRREEWRGALEALDAAEAELADEQQTKAKAGTHDYELQPVER